MRRVGHRAPRPTFWGLFGGRRGARLFNPRLYVQNLYNTRPFSAPPFYSSVSQKPVRTKVGETRWKLDRTASWREFLLNNGYQSQKTRQTLRTAWLRPLHYLAAMVEVMITPDLSGPPLFFLWIVDTTRIVEW